MPDGSVKQLHAESTTLNCHEANVNVGVSPRLGPCPMLSTFVYLGRTVVSLDGLSSPVWFASTLSASMISYFLLSFAAIASLLL
ncbi:hypothetical protein K488DRAFT_90971 [Vararia minispora EC-137]|uniref:Uncharacterized protein n=1 Tax=Vararia minispora EC-137 TaxID=1314806 RepID=A0ACB8Q6C3_9AGAM|nr:hypothetical protein K488DRAFT_90971 [Vararia minispora EC-137]